MKVIIISPTEAPAVYNLSKEHDYKDIKKILGIESPVDCIERRIGEKWYDLWIDDEGLFKEEKYVTAVCKDANEIIVGKIMIANHTKDGNIKGLTNEDIDNIYKNIVCNVFLPFEYDEKGIADISDYREPKKYISDFGGKLLSSYYGDTLHYYCFEKEGDK